MFKFLKEKISSWAKKFSKEEAKKPEPREEIREKSEKQQKKIEVTEKKEGFFERIKSKISKTEISEQDFNKYSEDLQNLLLENNVAYTAVEKIIWELKRHVLGKELIKKEIESEIKNTLRDTIEEMMMNPFDIVVKVAEKQANSKDPFVILFVGINGTGKTTTIAKIAEYLKGKKLQSVIAAADTFRAASIEQLKKHGEKLNIKIISQQYGSDPAAVGFDAISYAKKNHIPVVLIDTAGRMHTAKNLMKEIEKISNVCKPDLKLFIGESITGNDSVEQAKSFNEAVGIDGIILTKVDVDEKGGTAVSVSYVTRRPILFLGTGQNYQDLEPFDKRKFTEKLGL
ncbi:MAG: signal recognition particle-docking protein FtsY [Candidatus Pacearchaeota archaeon]